MNQRLPFVRTPFKLSGFLFIYAWSSADEDGTAIVSILNLDESQDEDIGVPANKALDDEVSEVAFWVSGYLVMFRFDEMEDNVGCESIVSFLVAEPFPACFVSAFDDAAFVSDGAVRAGVGRQFFFLGFFG